MRVLIAHRRLARLRTDLPRARCEWFLDSGAFSELSERGTWGVTKRVYAESAARYQREIGKLVYAAPQDWPCEPHVLAKTGSTLRRHQTNSIRSLLELRSLAPTVPWIPVLQGYAPDDYWRCIDLYESAGVNLSAEPLVGLGSICRRQKTREIRNLITALSRSGLALHGFGVKLLGLEYIAPELASADSLAWSYHARRRDPLPGCEHRNCNSCLRYALRWRRRVLRYC